MPHSLARREPALNYVARLRMRASGHSVTWLNWSVYTIIISRQSSWTLFSNT